MSYKPIHIWFFYLIPLFICCNAWAGEDSHFAINGLSDIYFQQESPRLKLNMPFSSDTDKSKPCKLHHIQTNAIWVSANLGSASVFDTDRNGEYHGAILFIDIGAHLRHHHRMISCGLQGGFFNEARGLSIYYLSYGKSIYYSVWQEIILSAGISRNCLSWSDDMSSASRIEAVYMGFPLRFQYLFHVPVSFGAGISFTVNLNHRASYFGFSVQAAFGAWVF